MATATQPLPPMPKPDVPLAKIDQETKTIKVDSDWYRYLTRLDALVRALRLEIP